MLLSKNSTNYVSIEKKQKIVKEILSIRLKDLPGKQLGAIKKGIYSYKENGNIYDLDTAKFIMFTMKARYYYRQKGSKLNDLIMKHNRMSEDSCYVRAIQMVERTELGLSPESYGFNKKDFKGDGYINLITSFGVSEGELKFTKKSERFKGENNPGYNHGGLFSPFSENFKKYREQTVDYNIGDIRNKSVETMKNNPHKRPTRIEYWLSLGYNENEAAKKLSEHQTNFSLDICKEKYGDEEGYRIWKERQEKWKDAFYNKSEEELRDIFKRRTKIIKGPISNIEQEFIGNIEKYLGNQNCERQYTIDTPERFYRYDFKFNDKIIEFNGDYWHANPDKYHEDYFHSKLQLTAKDIWEKDNIKNNVALDNGFKLKIVWESDYKNNKEKVIEECLNFLKQ